MCLNMKKITVNCPPDLKAAGKADFPDSWTCFFLKIGGATAHWSSYLRMLTKIHISYI